MKHLQISELQRLITQITRPPKHLLTNIKHPFTLDWISLRIRSTTPWKAYRIVLRTEVENH